MADVLIVDDDPDVGDALAEIMLLEGHEVRIARNGEEGMRLLNAQRPDLTLLDVEMPVLDGPAMALQMFLHNVGLEKVPIVLVSGIPELPQVAKEVGTPYFVAKPFRYERLMDIVARALSERAAPARSTAARGTRV